MTPTEIERLRGLVVAWDAAIESGPSSKVEDAYNAVTEEAMESIDDLLACAEALRDLAPLLRVVEKWHLLGLVTVSDNARDAARRALAILSPNDPPEGA